MVCVEEIMIPQSGYLDVNDQRSGKIMLRPLSSGGKDATDPMEGLRVIVWFSFSKDVTGQRKTEGSALLPRYRRGGEGRETTLSK